MTYKFKDTPWRDEDTMYQLYWEEGMSQSEMAEELDTTQKTISDWMKKLDIETRGGTPEKLKDSDWLHNEYVEKERSTLQIADEVGCTHRTVRLWLDRHDIETRPSTREKPPYFYTRQVGYEIVKSKVDGETKSVVVHRLQMVAEVGFDEVVENHVHHENHIPWDNRFENLSLVDSSEHAKIHSEKRDRDENGNYA